MKSLLLKTWTITGATLLATSALAGNHLILHAGPAAHAEDVRQMLLSNGVSGTVNIVSAATSTPTAAQLSAYDSILVYSNSNFQNATLLGDNLATYVDNGGGVVTAAFSHIASGSAGVRGRFQNQGYSAYGNGALRSNTPRQLGVIAEHPLTEGVTSFHGGSSSYHNQVTVALGATLVASYDNSVPLIAFRAFGTKAVVGLNFYPPSSNAASNFWVSTTSGGTMLANAVKFAAGEVNQAPEATDDEFTVEGGLPFASAAGVLANDTDAEEDPMAAELVTGATSGDLVLNADGSFTYTPNSGFTGLDSFTYRALDEKGASEPATVTLTVVDTRAPEFTFVPSDQVVTATSTSGATVFFDLPTATDLVDPAVTISSSVSSGDALPLGKTKISFTATDFSGNSVTAEISVWVQYSWSGAELPGGTNGKVKAGSARPVKFSLTGGSAEIRNANAVLKFRPVGGAAMECGTFRYDEGDGSYRFVWKSKGLDAGDYELLVDLGDGVERVVPVKLK